MALNIEEFLVNVKRAALEAVAASKPCALLSGRVTGTSPLRVEIDQKFTLTEAQLILTDAVRDHAVTLSDSGGDRKYTVKQALQAGEGVILLRADGGRKYLVLDRTEALK